MTRAGLDQGNVSAASSLQVPQSSASSSPDGGAAAAEASARVRRAGSVTIPIDQAFSHRGIPGEETPVHEDEAEKAAKLKSGFAGISEHHWSLQKLAAEFPESHINVDAPDQSNGLDASVAATRLEADGKNKLTPPPTTPSWLMFLKQFTDLFMILLLIAAGLSLLVFGVNGNFDDLYIGLVLIFVVLLTVTTSFLQARSSSKIMDSFANLLAAECPVVRGGGEQQITAEDLVKGDLVWLRGGDKVPADCRIIFCRSLKVENSSLTGESVPVGCHSNVEKDDVASNEARNMAFNGSSIIEGAALGLVIRTGDDTVIGSIAAAASNAEERETTMAIEIRHFVKFIAVLGIVMSISFFIIGIIRRGTSNFVDNLIPLVVILVANIPQGLPATVVSLLAIVAKRLASINVLVKRMDVVETLGSTSVICSDKTGTLTQNVMTVRAVWCDGHFIWGGFKDDFFEHTAGQARGSGSSRSVNDTVRTQSSLQSRASAYLARRAVSRSARKVVIPQSTEEHLYRIASVCNRALIEGPANAPAGEGGAAAPADANKPPGMGSQQNVAPAISRRASKLSHLGDSQHGGAAGSSRRVAKLNITGNPSEVALLRFCENVAATQPTRDAYPFVYEIPFNSTNKYHVVIIEERDPSLPAPPPGETNLCVLLKGAPERVLGFCDTYLRNGQRHELTPAFEDEYAAAYARFGDDGNRVLGFCYKRFTAPKDTEFSPEDGNVPMEGMTFVGLTAIADPPRDNVDHAVEQCHTAGIRIFMATGDHALTACAIARQIGILPEDATVQNGNVKFLMAQLPEVDEASATSTVSSSELQTASELEDADMKPAGPDDVVVAVHPPLESARASTRGSTLGSARGSTLGSMRGSTLGSMRGSARTLTGLNRANSIVGTNLRIETEASQLGVERHASSLQNTLQAANAQADANIAEEDDIKAEEAAQAEAAKHFDPGVYMLEPGEEVPTYAVVTGSEINNLTDEEWDFILSRHAVVFCRVTPDHKLEIVKRTQAMGCIVSMTGDGVNDAPALGRANVGIAMFAGSEVAKEAGDVVLMDNNFASIVGGIEQGRLVFDNLCKSIALTLAHLPPELVPVLMQVAAGIPSGLTSLLVLSIDLALDSTPAIALAYEPPEANIMLRAPRNVGKDRLVSVPLLMYSYLIIGVIETIGCFFSYAIVFWRAGINIADMVNSDEDGFFIPATQPFESGGNTFSVDEQNTILGEAVGAWYITLIIAQVCHAFNAKTRLQSVYTHGFFNNHALVYAAVCELCLAAIITYVPGIQDWFKTGPAPWYAWAIGLLVGVIITVYNEWRKAHARNHPDGWVAKWLIW